MMLRLSDAWVWDSWPFVAPDGRKHLFFLQAPRSLGDPELRHINASIGHAVSDDWRTWEVLPDALIPRLGEDAWDNGATWTGSVVQGPTGRFHLFYTGARSQENFLVQRIGRADSDDLIHWERFGDEPLLEADPRWYEKLDGPWHDEAWRDPWVVPDPDGSGWHMLITARANHGATFDRGVVGHAWSPDLSRWEVREPLTQPSRFGHLEVIQYVMLDGQPHLTFCCNTAELSPTRNPTGQRGGMWVARGEGLLGPWDIDAAHRVAHDSLYAARAIVDVDGSSRLLGFSDRAGDRFVGEILDPVDLDFEARRCFDRGITDEALKEGAPRR